MTLCQLICVGIIIDLYISNYKKNIQHARAEELFAHFADIITEEQMIFVEEQIGVNGSISRIKLAFILYSTFLNYKKNSLQT